MHATPSPISLNSTSNCPPEHHEHGHSRPSAHAADARDRDLARGIIALASLTSTLQAAGMLLQYVGELYHAIVAPFRHPPRRPARLRRRAPSPRCAGWCQVGDSIALSLRTAGSQRAFRRIMMQQPTPRLENALPTIRLLVIPLCHATTAARHRGRSCCKNSTTISSVSVNMLMIHRSIGSGKTCHDARMTGQRASSDV